MMNRLFPHPGLSAMLVAVWLLLANALSVGGLLLGIVLAVIVPAITAPFWPNRPRLRYGWPLVEYLAVVVWDIAVANFQVARLILFRRSRDLRSPEAITALAGTISLTPGTVSADVSSDGRSLLVHVLDVADETAEVARIKSRYERRLARVFA